VTFNDSAGGRGGWGPEISRAKYFKPVYLRYLRFLTFHDCHDLLTQVSLRVFEIIRRPSRGHPVTIHEAVTVVRREIKPVRNPRASGNPRKRHGEINNRPNATCHHVTRGFTAVFTDVPYQPDAFKVGCKRTHCPRMINEKYRSWHNGAP